MKKLFLAAVLFLSCASTQPVVNPAPPVVTPSPKQDTVYVPVKVYDTVQIVKHDTVFTVRTDTLTILKYQPVVAYLPDTLYQVIPYDTVINALHLAPVAGDNIAFLQAASDYCIAHGIPELDLAAGFFHTSAPWRLMSLLNGRYSDFGLIVKGATWAKNPISGLVTEIDPDFTNGSAIIVQQGKDVQLLNLMGWGKYGVPDTLTPLQIDTLSFSGWDDHICSRGPTNPYAFIVFDPFSDSTTFTGNFKMYAGLHQYYVPTGGSGSTACKVSGCFVQDFVVGVLITGGDNYNGEEIDVDDNQFDYDEVAYAYTQAQSKANTFNNNMIWGQTRIAVDGNHFGFTRGDAATPPFIDGMNVAGNNYEFIEGDLRAFSGSFHNIYSEGWKKLGVTGLASSRGGGVHFEDCQIDFIDDGPSPDFFYQGGGTTFTNCILRFYNGAVGPRRIIINDAGDRIEDGTESAPPLVVAAQINAPVTIVDNVNMYYDYTLGVNLTGNSYDSIAGGLVAYLTVDRSTFTGYYLTPDTGGLAPYMLLLTAALEPTDSASNYHPISQILNSQTIVGVYDHKNGDTVFMDNVGANFHTGDEVPIFKALYRKIN